MNDLRISFRSLRKSAGVSIVAVIIVALGIGAGTAIFSVLNALLLRPVPGIPRPAEIVALETVRKTVLHVSMSYPDYRDYRDRNRVFSSLAARNAAWVAIGNGDRSQRVLAELVTGNYFRTLDLAPAAGRFLGEGEGASVSAPAVAVLSYALWRSAFASDAGIVGRVVRINNIPFQVIGIAPPKFRGTVPGRTTDLYVPLSQVRQLVPHMSAGILENRTSLWLGVFGRLKSGITLQTAKSQMDSLARQIAAANPITNEGRTVQLLAGLGYDSEDRDVLRRFFVMVMSMFGLLLAIVCANVANLLLVRGAGRRREIAVRMALGASRGRIVRQLLVEGSLLSIFGALGGVFLAPLFIGFAGKLPPSLFGFQSIPAALDWRVMAFATTITFLCALAFSLGPALRATSLELTSSLKDGSSGAGVLRSRIPRLLVMMQVALSFVLLIGAGLMVRSFRNAIRSTSGFVSQGVLLASIDPAMQAYSENQGRVLFRSLLERLRQVPGVLSVGLAQTAPASSFVSKVSLFPPGQSPLPEQRAGGLFDLGVRTDFDPVTPGYFDALSIARLRGRDFTLADDENAPTVCIVSASLAYRLWPNSEAIGQVIEWPPDNGPLRRLQVIGVVADTSHRSPLETAPLMVYMPLLQVYDSRATIIVRFRGEPALLSQQLMATVASIDPKLPVFSIRTLDEQVQTAVWQQDSAARLIGLFGVLALLLAATGLYALVSYLVARRTRELGIRMALGARRASLLLFVIRQSFGMVFAGLLIGLATAWAATPLLQRLLFGVSRYDLGTFSAVTATLCAFALVASWVPAYRASRIDPVVALRHE